MALATKENVRCARRAAAPPPLPPKPSHKCDLDLRNSVQPDSLSSVLATEQNRLALVVRLLAKTERGALASGGCAAASKARLRKYMLTLPLLNLATQRAIKHCNAREDVGVHLTPTLSCKSRLTCLPHRGTAAAATERAFGGSDVRLA